MSENAEKGHVTRQISTEEKASPAITVVATDFDVESIVRILLRANEYGLFVFVVVEATDTLIARVAEKFDAAVLELGFADIDPPIEAVEQLARTLGFPAVLYFDDVDARIDFSQCETVAEESGSYGTDAPLIDDASTERTETVAAIPTYNEEDTIGSVVNEVQQHVDEVLVIDDKSTDDTVAVAEQTSATVIEHDRNHGYGAALKTAFESADDRDAESLVILDGDGQHDPQDIPKLFDALQETEANLVIGSRFHDARQNVPYYRRIGLFVINTLTNLSLGVRPTRWWITDTQSGFRAYDSTAISSLAAENTISDNMSASTDILYHARRMDYDVKEVSTTIYYNDDETSTQHPFVHGLSVVSNIVRTVERERPLTFLGLPGIITVLLGVSFGYWAITNYVQSGTFPTGIVLFCIFSTVLGSLFLFTGIILHSVRTQLDTISERTIQG